MTSTEKVIDLPKGTKAYREYEVEMSGGSKVSLAFTLNDLNAEAAAARSARQRNAVAFGLVSIIDLSGAPDQGLLWMVDSAQFYLVPESGRRPISDELQEVIKRYLRLFFIQIGASAPDLPSAVFDSLDPAANGNRTVQ